MPNGSDVQQLRPDSSINTKNPLNQTLGFTGRHIIAELYGVDPILLDDEAFITQTFKTSIPMGGAILCDISSKKFSPSGVTLLALLAESHASCHTYPEQGCMFVDVFTCGDCHPRVIYEHIVEQFNPTQVTVKEFFRGESKSGPTAIYETLGEGVERIWKIDKIISEAKTDYQDIVIGKTAHGIGLFCNNERQSTELSQQIYHEGQFYPAALLSDSLNRVLVIGSSEGVVSEMAVANGAKEVVHVDIDLDCVQMCASHLPYGYSNDDVKAALRGDGVVKLVVQDGFSYVKTCLENGEEFDVIVMDLPDEQAGGDAQQNRLYDDAFLGSLSDLLTPGGAFITQAGNCAYWRNESLKHAWKRMNGIFETAVFYELDEQDWAWIVGLKSKCADPRAKMKAKLPSLPLAPTFIDSLAIERCTVPPISIRRDV